MVHLGRRQKKFFPQEDTPTSFPLWVWLNLVLVPFAMVLFWVRILDPHPCPAGNPSPRMQDLAHAQAVPARLPRAAGGGEVSHEVIRSLTETVAAPQHFMSFDSRRFHFGTFI